MKVIGGMSAVIYTEVLQTVVLVVGAFILMVISLVRIGGISGLMDKLPPEYFNMMKPIDDKDYPWTGIIFGFPVLSTWYWCTDQVIVQRALAAKNEAHAKTGTVMAAYLKILPVFLIILPGMIARVLYADEVKA
jgi:SSS family solute:Na+ symporter